MAHLPRPDFADVSDFLSLHGLMSAVIGGGGNLRRAIGKSPVFWDFCRYLILHDTDPSMKKTALVWLAQEKGYGLVEFTLDHRLANCLAGMTGPDAPTVEAMEILDAVHPDTGAFAASMERAKTDAATRRHPAYSKQTHATP